MQAEIKLQAECFQWAWNLHPETRRCLWHVPNEGKRSKVEANQMKAIGVVAGIHDLHFLWQGRFHTFELKTEVGTLTPGQKDFWAAVTAQGGQCFLVRDFPTFKRLFLSILGKPQET